MASVASSVLQSPVACMIYAMALLPRPEPWEKRGFHVEIPLKDSDRTEIVGCDYADMHGSPNNKAEDITQCDFTSVQRQMSEEISTTDVLDCSSAMAEGINVHDPSKSFSMRCRSTKHFQSCLKSLLPGFTIRNLALRAKPKEADPTPSHIPIVPSIEASLPAGDLLVFKRFSASLVT